MYTVFTIVGRLCGVVADVMLRVCWFRDVARPGAEDPAVKRVALPVRHRFDVACSP
jgi:hypothetical protein